MLLTSEQAVRHQDLLFSGPSARQSDMEAMKSVLIIGMFRTTDFDFADLKRECVNLAN